MMRLSQSGSEVRSVIRRASSSESAVRGMLRRDS